MAFFRKWTINYKHKKLNEDWGLTKSVKELSISESSPPEDAPPEEESLGNIKYLGSTAIGSQKTQRATSSAIKSVITNAKAIKKKDLRRVRLEVSPQGVNVVNEKTGELELHVSIYKISYCSVDAAHDHIFSFVGAEKHSATDEQLACYVFECPKRKIAYSLTLKVAKCFETAYNNWRDAVDEEVVRNAGEKRQTKGGCDKADDVLIDFAKSFEDNGGLLNGNMQISNAWVSFDDDDNEAAIDSYDQARQQLVM